MFVCHVSKLFEDELYRLSCFKQTDGRQRAELEITIQLKKRPEPEIIQTDMDQTDIRQTRKPHHDSCFFFVEDWMMFVGLVSHGFKTSSIVEGVSNRQTVDRG